MTECNPAHTAGAGAKLSLGQPATTLLNSTHIQLYQAITGYMVSLSQCTRYDTTNVVN